MTWVIRHTEFEEGDIIQKYDETNKRWNYWSTIQSREDCFSASNLVDMDSNYRVVRGAKQAIVLME